MVPQPLGWFTRSHHRDSPQVSYTLQVYTVATHVCATGWITKELVSTASLSSRVLNLVKKDRKK